MMQYNKQKFWLQSADYIIPEYSPCGGGIWNKQVPRVLQTHEAFVHLNPKPTCKIFSLKKEVT